MKTLIISPVHKQPTQEWVEALKGKDVFIIDDSNGKIDIPFESHDYATQKKELGKLYGEFTMFHKDAACKIYGLWQAYKRGYDNAIVLDSDCVIPDDFIDTHEKALRTKAHGWTNPLESIGWFSRGYPYSERKKEVVANMGLWKNNLDINGKDRIGKDVPKKIDINGTYIAHNEIPLCGMNLAIKRDAIPALLFLPSYEWKWLDFKRYDDIFGGYIFEQIVKKMNGMITYGDPIVFHEDPVYPEQDAKEEEAMIFMEDTFYRAIDDLMAGIKGDTHKDIFAQFANRTDIFEGSAFEPMIKFIKFFKKLYEK